jgi:hypothetical protein
VFPAQIEDGCDEDDWRIADYRTGSSIPLRADRWYQQAQGSISIFISGDFAVI